ncbi:MAG: type I restriction enzyme HsdR N-terminal domain-containing protein [Agriterribacter sp.]
MIKIEYPVYEYKIETRGEKEVIFDPVRKQWINLSPEEWVRQNFLQYLLQIKKYPPALIAVEKEIYLGDLKKRCDIIVYDQNAKALMIVECKAMDVELNIKTVEQTLRYNMSLAVKYLVITNGLHSFGFERSLHDFKVLETIPDFIPLSGKKETA